MRKGKRSGIPALRHTEHKSQILMHYWIPAFAGMTSNLAYEQGSSSPAHSANTMIYGNDYNATVKPVGYIDRTGNVQPCSS